MKDSYKEAVTDAAIVISAISAGTSVGSLIAVGIALRRSRPRVRVGSADGFAFTARSLKDGVVTTQFRVMNLTEKPAHIAKARIIGLAPLARGSEPGVVRDTFEGLLSGQVRSLPGKRTSWSSRNARPPRKHKLRRPADWQQFAQKLPLGPDANPSIGPFAVTAFDVEVSTLLVRTAHWLRIEVQLPTGTTGCSAWWPNNHERAYLAEEVRPHTTSRSLATARRARATIAQLVWRRRQPEAGD